MTDEQRDLDEQLRRLFTDERLTLPVAVAAEQVVVTGAQRRRRRRLAVASASGVLAVAAVVFLASTLTGIGRARGHVTVAAPPHLTQTLTTIPSTPTPMPTTTVPSAAGQLDVDGVDGLRLGMSVQQVWDVLRNSSVPKQAGVLGKCADYELVFPGTEALPPIRGATATPTSIPDSVARAGSAPSTIITLVVSPTYGVVQIGGSRLVHTPEGVYPGMVRDRIDAIYPSVVLVPGSKVTDATPSSPLALAAPVPGRPGDYYVFTIGPANTVESVWLRRGAVLPC